MGVPKDVASLCGPNYSGVICDLSGQDSQLNKIWRADRPVWVIKGVCNPGGSGKKCDDNDPCTENDVYVNGVCKGTLDPCTDNFKCTKDYCNPSDGICYHDVIPGCKEK